MRQGVLRAQPAMGKGLQSAMGWRSMTATALPMVSTRAFGSMFCFQCEQTDGGTGCKTVGVCGKTPEVANMQDVLMHSVKAIGAYRTRLDKLGAAKDEKLASWMATVVFSTLTNVNFDADAFKTRFLPEARDTLERVRHQYDAMDHSSSATLPDSVAHFRVPLEEDEIASVAKEVGIPERKAKMGDDYVGLQELITYGLKGALAYAHHAEKLGETSDKVWDFSAETFDFLTREDATVPELLGKALEVGAVNLEIMEMLDRGHTKRYGVPEPTKVRTTPIEGKAILVSGHDLVDLEKVLKATEGKGINVYTHGEMLPAHAYPSFKKYPHLVGNYGSAWQMQQFEFGVFPGSIFMTSNCIVEPRRVYKDRIFTRDVVGWPTVTHLDGELDELVQAALAEDGFTADDLPAEPKFVTTGFGHNAVLGVADTVVDAVKAGKISRFFLIGGCDGAEGERSYFTDMAKLAPKDSVILTLACGKFRLMKLHESGFFGDIEGIPRILDMGQCNDSYSAIRVAGALAEAFETDLNSLPLSFVISWFEQKAVAVLLTLLHLGVKNIHLGPALPAFATENMMAILQKEFSLRRIESAEEDMKRILAS